MPHFFRHFAPKIASKISFQRASQSSGSNNRDSGCIVKNQMASVMPVHRAMEAVPQWHDPYDTATSTVTTSRTAKPRRERYLEWHTSRDGRSPTMEITGDVSLGLIDEEAGIMKTVRVITIPADKAVTQQVYFEIVD